MSSVKLVAKLPADDTDDNGLDRHLGHFRTHPHEQLVAVVYLSTAKLVTAYAGDVSGVTPYVQIDAVEVIGEAADLGASAVVAAFAAARARRLDRDPSLFDVTPEAAEPDQLALTDGVDIEATLHQVNQVLAEEDAGEIVDAEILDDDEPGDADDTEGDDQ